MIDINTALSNILKSIYGKDVRQSIHDAIYQINQNANEAVDLAQIKFGTAVTGPTSPVGSYIEGTVYFNVSTGVIWRLSGGSWSQLGSMKSIDTIAKTSTSGLTDTYTITYNDGTTSTYSVKNGEKGTSITSVTKGTTAGLVDHYDINLSDGTKEGFDVTNGADGTNGVSISNISLASTVGNVKNYDVNLSDGTKTATGFSVTDGTSNYVHIRYSASFDGSGMVSVPTSTTVYIGIVVTTQSTAPTDPSVYSWVRFIGESGSGNGDMLKTEYATKYAGVVDKAAALYDGTNEILANQLVDKTTYCAKGVAGTVDKATELVDVTNSKTADTVLLANLTDDAGQLKYKGNNIGSEYITSVSSDFDVTAKKLSLNTSVTAKLSRLDNGLIPCRKMVISSTEATTDEEFANVIFNTRKNEIYVTAPDSFKLEVDWENHDSYSFDIDCLSNINSVFLGSYTRIGQNKKYEFTFDLNGYVYTQGFVTKEVLSGSKVTETLSVKKGTFTPSSNVTDLENSSIIIQSGNVVVCNISFKFPNSIQADTNIAIGTINGVDLPQLYNPIVQAFISDGNNIVNGATFLVDKYTSSIIGYFSKDTPNWPWRIQIVYIV